MSAYLALLLADGRLPTGAHTQSAGLEPAMGHGLPLERVPDYMRARLLTVTEVEAATAVVARSAWLARPSADAMRPIDLAWRVRTVSDALRDASDLLGRSYLRFAAAVWDLGALAGTTWCRPVVVGATAAVAGLTAAETARLVGYDDVATVVSAALKLSPFDPSRAVAWNVAAAVDVEAMVRRVADLDRPADIPAHAAPLIEEWGQRHRSTERRLFRA